MNKCSLVMDILPLYIDGQLEQENYDFVSKHLKECHHCAEVYKRMRVDFRSVKETPIDNYNPRKPFTRYLNTVRFTAVSLTAFVIFIFLFWVNWLLIPYSWSHFFDDVFRVSNVAQIPLFVFIAFWGIFSIFAIIGKRKKEGKRSLKKTIVIIGTILLIISIHIIPISMTINVGEEQSVLSSIEAKETEKNQYYFYIKNIPQNNLIKIKCNENVYNLLETNPGILYSFTYRPNLFDDSSGVMYQIDFNEVIDNRI